ncbi:DoxX family membrane protein [Balneolaceae bacterium YR4-1]|uniref:DoxX family membrane protein n=1 Tax=Halalkalibaculum roseum TaxID=2709311 RepID=A0A6M1TD35_9BACT|nr:MauE/DoxX family redox-associated membrane protein [Halalkalibaculum roseum]NGP78083.1 DoxX family membrane protein [Halalkalibaculum roseum]
MQKNILLTIRILLGLIFLASGVGKLIDSSDARYLVELLASEFYWLIEYADPIVIGTSLIELILASLLLWGKKVKLSLWASLLMVSVFTAVLGHFYLQGMSIESCGCFGALGIGGGLTATLIRNAVLLILVSGGLILSSRLLQTRSIPKV